MPLKAQYLRQQSPKPRCPGRFQLQVTRTFHPLLRAPCLVPCAVFSPIVSPIARTVLPSGSVVVNSCSSVAEQLCNFVCDCSDCSDENQCGGCPDSPGPQTLRPYSWGESRLCSGGLLWVKVPGVILVARMDAGSPRMGTGPQGGCSSTG